MALWAEVTAAVLCIDGGDSPARYFCDDEEMQKRRDEWNNRVRRAVKRKDEASDEGARDDEA